MSTKGWTSKGRRGALVLASLALVACGGGGGGGDGDGPPGTIDVTLANKDTLARAIVVAVQGGLALDSAGGLVAAPSVVTRSKDAVSRALRVPSSADREQAKGLVDLGTEACAQAGTVSGTLDDQDGDGMLSLGETVTLVFTGCRDDATEVINGTLAMTVTAASGAPLSFTARASMTSLVVSSTASSRSASYSGDFTLSYSEPTPTTASTQMQVGTALAVQMSHPQYSDTVTLQAGYVLRLDYDAAAVRTTARADGKVASQQAGGLVTVNTIEPLEQDDFETYPHQGAVQALGKNGSVSLRVLTSPTPAVQVGFDQGDGGTYEDSDIVGWDFFL